MLRSLPARLAVALVVLLLAVGVVAVASTLWTTRLHAREAEQRVHRDLAKRIVKMKADRFLGEGGNLRRDGLGDLFHWLMVVNPRLELYLLDPGGRILAFDAPPGAVRLERVDPAPIREILDEGADLPVFGDDPRRPERGALFSAARLGAEEDPVGFLYVVLESEEVGSAIDRLAQSSILRLSIGGAIGVLVLFGLAWSLLFAQLTRPLRRLTERMRAFRTEDGERTAATPRAEGDEVQILEATFDEMTLRIAQQLEDIRRMEVARRELVANVSHDLRTPLAAMRGYLETLALLGSDDERAEEREEYLAIAHRHAERLSRLVDELFELTELDSPEMELRRERFSLGELVQDNVQRFRGRAEEKGLELEADLERGVPTIEADLGLLERVLENLLENAVRHTPEGGSVEVCLSRVDGFVEVAVEDTGSGIEPEEIPHLFERWQCGDGGGTGLGLAIARRILELHGSDIEVESRPGEGSVFRFRLPTG